MSVGPVYIGNNVNNPVPVEINTNSAVGDAFGRLRVSPPATVFDSKQISGDGVDVFWDTVTNGTGSIVYNQTLSESNFSVTSNGDYAIKQTKQHWSYQPGKGQRILCTGVLHPEVGTTKAIGPIQGSTSAPYSLSDGLCFETIDDVIYCSVYRNGVAEHQVPQSEWNVDRLDGTGPSGVTLDLSKTQIFGFDYEWLGVGRARYSCNILGKDWIVHVNNNANFEEQVYMRSGNQPIRYEIRSTGSAGTLKQICCSVQSEGGQEPTGLVSSVDTGNNTQPTDEKLKMICAIRLKDTALDAAVYIERASLISASAGNIRWCILFNPTITGTPNWVDVDNSPIQSWVTSTNQDGDLITDQVIQMDSGFSSNNLDAANIPTKTNLGLGSNIDGTRDVIALCAQNVNSTSNEQIGGGLIVRQLL